MKILFIGDSYSTNYSPLSWTSIIEKHFDAKSMNMSRPASSFYYSFNNMYFELKHNYYDTVIFAITSIDRLYHKEYILHGGFPQRYDGKPVPTEVVKSLKSYYTHLYDPDLIPIGWTIACHALVSISLEHPKTKFIFLPAFNNEFTNINFGNCVITSKRLLDYSMLDKEAHEAEFLGKPVDRNNHLTHKQNKTLATNIIRFLENYNFGNIEYKVLEKMEEL